MESNHDDNKDVFSNRKKGDFVLISSNKTVTSTKTSRKRKKSFFE